MKIYDLSVQKRGRLATKVTRHWKQISRECGIEPTDVMNSHRGRDPSGEDYSQGLFERLSKKGVTMETLAKVFRALPLSHLITGDYGFPVEVQTTELVDTKLPVPVPTGVSDMFSLEGEDEDAGENTKACLVCHISAKQCLMVPCRHVTLCIKCSNKDVEGGHQIFCRHCRGRVVNIVRIYY